MTVIFPPLDGSITVLPGFLDFHAEHNRDKPFAQFPSISGTGVTSVSFAELAETTHRIAHTLRPNREGADREVVGVLIHCDVLLYVATLLGIIRAGLVPLPISPRNSAAAIANLLEQTSAHRLISQASLSSLTKATQEELLIKGHPLFITPIPSLSEVFPTLFPQKTHHTPVVPYPKAKNPRTQDEVVLYLHSSGSTGFPKAIPQTGINILDWSNTPISRGSRNYGIFWASMSLPTFHTMGMLTQVYAPLVTGFPIGLYTPQAPLSPVVPTPENVLEVSKKLGCNGIPAVPAFLEIWAQSDKDMEYLASLSYVVFGGGPLSTRSGDRLVAAGVKLFSGYGATETGAVTTAFDISGEGLKAPTDWVWMALSREVTHRWVLEGDGSYELQLLTSETYHPSVENLPDTRGYSTKDLFVPHPTKKGLWRITGRKDDVLVLGTGEKIVPLPQEGRITSDMRISGAVMFGRGKSQCGILIEPRKEYALDPHDEVAIAKFKEDILPVVEEANTTAPNFARIFKEMILLTDPARPLPRAAKSTVIRKQALALYDEEIQALYRSITENAVNNARAVQPPATFAASDIQDWLMRLASSLNRDVPVSATIDVFDQGFDSLHATFLRNHIISTLQAAEDPKIREASSRVPQSFVFDHPTLYELAQSISALAASDDLAEMDLSNEIIHLVDKYSANLPIYTPKVLSPNGIVVLLTGSTGNIGCHILSTLLSNPHITKVYTLNRLSSTPSAERQTAAFKERCLPIDLLSAGKAILLAGDLSQDCFGLPSETYNEIVRTVTHVIHNAWKVDFNQSLKSFEPLIASTRRLVDVCYTFAQPVKIFYTSSISAAAGYDPTVGPVPEEPLTDPKVVLANGYGASKFVVEKILANTSAKGLPTLTLRIGQVCGAEGSGAWSTREWVSILVKSSISVGALPDLDGTVSWIPMDAVASAVADFVLAAQDLPDLVNVVHPRRVGWHEILEHVNRRLSSPLPFVSFDEWVERVASWSANPTAGDLNQVPAIKLLDFFRGMAIANRYRPASENVEAGGAPVFSTLKLEASSRTIQKLLPLNENHAGSWVSYWESKHFL